MLINSYLAFCLLLFAFCFLLFSMTTLLQIGVDLRDIAFPVFVRQTHWQKKTHITQTIVCRLIVSVLQTNSVFSRFLLLSSSFNSKLSVNLSWVKCSIFKTSQRSHSPERAQEVKSFPQWSGEGHKSVMSMSSDICNFCICATGCQKFSDIR